ncbi:MAG TPA: universal stress protein [Ramlibacter sp.]|nr:universal stress protein [Ramlibacter sp.]
MATAPFARLLLATEHTEFDTGAEALAIALARRCGLPLVAVLPVVSNPEFEVTAPQLAERADSEALQRCDALQEMALAQQVRLEAVVRRGPELDAEIVDEARQRHSDLIVIRRRGKRGFLANLLIGEMVSKVVAQAPCSVLVAPRKARMFAQRVMVGVDPQAPSDKALGLAAGIALDCGLPLRVVCVVSTDAFAAQAELALSTVLNKARAICPTVDGELRVGRVHDQLVLAAKACGADLLVMSRHRGDRLQRLRIGSVTQKVIGLAECPVLVHVSPSEPA